MKICSPALFYDSENHIWRFYVNNNRDLMYSIMYAEDKWTKEIKIDNEVLDFVVNLNIDKKISIFYSVKSGDIKYFIWDMNKCYGKTIYKSENYGYDITELNVITVNELVHLFFIGKTNVNKNQCSLTHLCLNKDKSSNNTIDTIPFLDDIFYHYQVHNLENGDLSLIFIKHDDTESVINFTEYKNNKWSIPKRLYGIIGKNVNFCTFLQLNKINIMNLSKEDSLYVIEHVLIQSDGKMKSYKIHETFQKPTSFYFMEISGVLCAIWAEDKNIYTSSYIKEWSEPNKQRNETINEFSLYKYISLNKKNNNIKCKYVLGTDPPVINLIEPSYENINYIDDYKEISIAERKKDVETNIKEDKIDMNKELLFLQNNNRKLEKEIINLKIKYQQKVRALDELEGIISKLTNDKKKAEDKLNIISQIQQTTMKKLKVMEVDKVSRDVVIDELTNKSKRHYSEYKELMQQKTSKDNMVSELKNRLNQLTNEKEGLSQDLIFEKNIGFVDRLFKKRTER